MSFIKIKMADRREGKGFTGLCLYERFSLFLSVEHVLRVCLFLHGSNPYNINVLPQFNKKCHLYNDFTCRKCDALGRTSSLFLLYEYAYIIHRHAQCTELLTGC